jgi:hypothetical protein
MADVATSLKRLVSELGRERARLASELARVDADLADAQRMLARREERSEPREPTTRIPGRASSPGEAQREALRLMADQQIWTPSRLSAARGTTAQAAGNLLRRLEKQGLVEAVPDAQAGYRISSLLAGERQELLPLVGATERDAD